MHALLLLALFQVAPPSSVALRSGCSAEDPQIASISPSEPVEVGMALAGEGQTCYRVTLSRGGEKVRGYVLGESLAAIRAFVHGRELASEAAAEAEVQLAREQATAKTEKNNEPDKPTDPLVSTQFEDFSTRRLDGKLFSLSSLKGRVTVVTFWSPSHPSSMGELESWGPIYAHLRSKGLAVVGVSIDPRPERALEALDDTNLPFAHVLDQSGLAARYHVDPKAGKTLVLDANHRVVAAGPMSAEMEKTVRQLLGVPDAK